MYTTLNFRTKKALREAVEDGGHITIQGGNFGPMVIDGEIDLEGPHGVLHTWYAKATLVDGAVTNVR